MQLDCGHATEDGQYGTRDGQRHCYLCCDQIERLDMYDADQFLAYLSSDGRTLTTWTGGHLADVTWTSAKNYGHTPTGGYYERWYLHATDLWGGRWTGQTPGRGMYVRLRRRAGTRYLNADTAAALRVTA